MFKDIRCHSSKDIVDKYYLLDQVMIDIENKYPVKDCLNHYVYKRLLKEAYIKIFDIKNNDDKYDKSQCDKECNE